MKSPLTEHARGAVFAEYSGWEMPAHYGDMEAEYWAAREGTGLRDASHWSRLLFSGQDHLDFLHRMTTNHFKELQPNAGLEAIFPDNRGRILELGTFYRAGETTLAVLSPLGREKIPAWLDRYIFAEKIAIEDITQETAMIEVAGPGAAALVQKDLDKDLGAVAEHHLLGDPGGGEVWLARLDRFGHPGLRAIGPVEQIRALGEKLREGGAHPLGEAAWEILRVEEGLALYGRELTEEHNPWEAGQSAGRAIHLNKGCYIGQEVIARLDTYDKVKQRLMGLELPDGPLPPAGALLRSGNAEAGRLTSAVYSPGLERNLALAYVRRDHWDPGTPLQVEGLEGAARVVELPFA